MSQGIKDMFKGGYHPGKNSSQNLNIRGKSKTVNTAAGWVGHAKKDDEIDMRDHSSAPLSTLKDPSSFGPPPKHVSAHGQEAANASAKNSGQTGSALKKTQGLQQGGVAKSQTWSNSPSAQQRESEESTPPIPSRAGLSSQSPVRVSSPVSNAGQASPKPKLPPRLPARRDAGEEGIESPPPPYREAVSEEATGQSGYVNQAAAGRLGRAGVSVPGLGVGRASQSNSASPRQSNAPSSQGQMNELSSRFAKMGRTGSNDTSASTPSAGTSWSQKQSALKTADSFKRDPSSVSMSDARSAASTANNFRQRHGEQVTAGVNKANSLGQKYGTDGSPVPAGQPSAEDEEEEEEQGRSGSTAVASAAAAKKKPPPPPKKKSLAVDGGNQGAQGMESPPPIPMGSKPR